MTETGICRLTVFIPHGNTIAELQKAIKPDEVIWGGLPRCIPIFVDADEAFRSLWQIHFDKHSKCVGIPVKISFSEQLHTVLQQGTDLEKIRQSIPEERCLSFKGNLVPVELLPSPADYVLIMGIKKTPAGESPESVSLLDEHLCKTFQIANLVMELSGTGLLTWQVTESCWAPRS